MILLLIAAILFMFILGQMSPYRGTYVINKGSHNHNRYLFMWPKLIFWKPKNTIKISANVRFQDSCRYNLAYPDNLDINKLLGLSYLNIHKNSVRIGWRYELKTDDIKVFIYRYQDGKRILNQICNVGINELIKINLSMNESIVSVKIDSTQGIKYIELPVQYNHTYFLYTTNLYFGGNQPSPSKIKIDIFK